MRDSRKPVAHTDLELRADCRPPGFASRFQGVLVVAAGDVFKEVIDEVKPAFPEQVEKVVSECVSVLFQDASDIILHLSCIMLHSKIVDCNAGFHIKVVISMLIV